MWACAFACVCHVCIVGEERGKRGQNLKFNLVIRLRLMGKIDYLCKLVAPSSAHGRVHPYRCTNLVPIIVLA